MYPRSVSQERFYISYRLNLDRKMIVCLKSRIGWPRCLVVRFAWSAAPRAARGHPVPPRLVKPMMAPLNESGAGPAWPAGLPCGLPPSRGKQTGYFHRVGPGRSGQGPSPAGPIGPYPRTWLAGPLCGGCAGGWRAEGGGLRQALLRCAALRAPQVSQTAGCCRRYPTSRRLSLGPLMCKALACFISASCWVRAVLRCLETRSNATLRAIQYDK